MKMAELKMLPVSVLKPAEYNPRKKLKKGDKEYKKIADSIREFGFADPLVVNADMTIIGGHQRLTVAVDLGYTEVPCAVVDVDKTREKALNIALNKITGAWDDQMLADLLKDLENVHFNLDFTGFEAPEIGQLFSNIYDKKVKEDNFDVDSELKQPVFSKFGDVWHLGKHRVICGDSTKMETYRAKASFLCNEELLLQLMMLKDGQGNYIWRPALDVGKPDTILGRPIYTSGFMPGVARGNKVMTFGDYSYYWVADRASRTFRRLNELFASTDQVGFMTTQRVDGKLILPEAVKVLVMGNKANG